VEEVAGSVAFIADGRRFGRLQGSETVESMAAEHAGTRSPWRPSGPSGSGQRNGAGGAAPGSETPAKEKSCRVVDEASKSGRRGAGGSPLLQSCRTDLSCLS